MKVVNINLRDNQASISRRIMRLSHKLIDRAIPPSERILIKDIKTYLPLDIKTEYANFLLACANWTDSKNNKEIEIIAAAINLLQASTFVIDDVLDASSTRNHNMTIFRKSGTSVAVTCGEVMQTIATDTIFLYANQYFPSQAANIAMATNLILRDVYLGQYIDVTSSGAQRMSINRYKKMIALTTGHFFQYVARIGASLNKRTLDAQAPFEKYGFCYGMALQISDDIVDVDNTIVTGKEFASDIKNKRHRLPLLLALQLGNKEDLEILNAFLSGKSVTMKQCNVVIDVIRRSGSLKQCVRLAKQYYNKGKKAISILDSNVTKRRLLYLMDSMFEAQGVE